MVQYFAQLRIHCSYIPLFTDDRFFSASFGINLYIQARLHPRRKNWSGLPHNINGGLSRIKTDTAVEIATFHISESGVLN
jgi:hypothetical protein